MHVQKLETLRDFQFQFQLYVILYNVLQVSRFMFKQIIVNPVHGSVNRKEGRTCNQELDF